MYLFAHLADTRNFPIVQFAIVEDEFHIRHKGIDVVVALVLKLAFHCAEVHWFFHDVKVIGNFETFGIDRLLENPSRAISAKVLEHTVCSLFPVIVNGCKFVHWGYFKLTDGFYISLFL